VRALKPSEGPLDPVKQPNGSHVEGYEVLGCRPPACRGQLGHPKGKNPVKRPRVAKGDERVIASGTSLSLDHLVAHLPAVRRSAHSELNETFHAKTFRTLMRVKARKWLAMK
jgi:hypothetical protein